MTNSPPKTGLEIDAIKAQIDQLTQVKKQIQKQKMSKSQTLASRQTKRQQQFALVELAQAKDNLTMFGTLSSIAAQINFQGCNLDVDALRGALLQIMEQSGDPKCVADFHRRNAEYFSLKRRAVTGVSGYLIATDPSAELIAAARANNLRHNKLAGGFGGTAEVEVFVDLAVRFQASVRVTIGRETKNLVTDGIPHEDVIDRAKQSSASQNAHDIPKAASDKTEQVKDAPVELPSTADILAASANRANPLRPVLQSRTTDPSKA